MSTLKLPIGIDNFLQLLEADYTFVDKSLFIKEVIDTSAQIVFITQSHQIKLDTILVT